MENLSDIQGFEVIFVKGGKLLKEAQELRGRVFFSDDRIDEDKFDKICDHIVVIDKKTKNIVGTYRLLLGSIAKEAEGLYSETEFDLRNIWKNCSGELLEMGRACVEDSYRNSAVLNVMWKAIYSYIEQNGVKYILGCASVENPSVEKIGKIFSFFKDNRYSKSDFRVFPLKGKEYPHIKIIKDYKEREILRLLPSLIKSYLKMGAFVCGEPVWDKEFGTVDFFMMVETKNMNATFLKKFS